MKKLLFIINHPITSFYDKKHLCDLENENNQVTVKIYGLSR